MHLNEAISAIRPPDAGAAARAAARWDSIAKPLHSLGLLEDMVVQLAAATRSHRVCLDRRCLAVLCADNGVVCQGVTQTGQEVTAAVARGMLAGSSCVCHMARVARADVVVADVGMAEDLEAPGLLVHKSARGTADITAGPAMSREQALGCLEFGIGLAAACKGRGYHILATGEMGIGNTTTSSALTAVLLGRAPRQVTGRGAGLSREGLERKVAAIERAIAVNRPDGRDPLDVLCKVGGFDLCGLCGLFIGGAAVGLPVIVDGFISAAAALAAVRLAPGARPYLLPSHASAEPGAALVLEALGFNPPLCCGMHLGEGTGAVSLLPLLDMALAVYQGMHTFEEMEIDSYLPLA